LADLNINQTLVFEKLKELIEGGSIRAIEVYLNYRFGKPREKIETSVRDEVRKIIFVSK